MSSESPGSPAESSGHEEFARLERAMAVWTEFRAAGDTGPGATARLLTEHEELRDLLEPLLGVGGADGAGEDGGPEDGGPEDGNSEAPGAAPRRLGAGEFELQDELGRGGMGVVYRARQRGLDRLVAVKVVADVLGMAPRAIARFRREATTAGRLQHPGIVDVLSSGEDDGVHWLAMELVEGRSLDEHCRELPLRERLELIAQVADALHHLHGHGVVHRDVKPSNVLVRASDGQPLLTDFGLAREQGLPALSRTGDFAGTPYYVAPEQARGDSAVVDRRADVFSLGVTAYQVVTGQRPFDGPSTAAILHSIATREPPDPQRLAPGMVRRDLAAVLLKALEKDPGDRYPDAAAFATDLRAFLDLRPVQARRAGPWRRTLRFARREPLRFALAAVLALGLPTVAVLGWNLFVQQDIVEVGSETLRQREIDRLLLEATRWKFLQLPDRAGEVFDRALALAPRDPLVVGLAALHHGGEVDPGVLRDAERARLILDAASPEVRELPAIRRVRHWVETAGRGEALVEPPVSAFEYYVAGHHALSRGFAGDPQQLQIGLASLRAAVLRSERATPVFLSELHVAAFMAEDEDLERDTVEALMHLWPEAPVSHVFWTFYWYDRDDARCREAAEQLLELEPGFFWAQWKVGEMAQRAGDLDTAVELMQTAWQNSSGYPKLGVSLAFVYWERQENDKALQLAEEMARIVGRRDPLTMQLLLVAQRRAGLEEAATATAAEIEALEQGR